jgi:hypothetical protein
MMKGGRNVVASFETAASHPPQDDGVSIYPLPNALILRSADRRVSKDAVH